jgi:thioredoxin
MKNIIGIISFIILLFGSNNLMAQTSANLDANTFASKLKQQPSAQIVDVRTSGEFSQGHIQNAKNIDVSSNSFQQLAAKLDKNKAVYVYCLSGSRSSYAMNVLSQMGFNEIYNLTGGMMRWRAANLPETTNNESTKPASSGMTIAQYQALLNTNKLVLIDFYAEWCSPCKKMKPYLDEISKEMKDKVVVIRIDADANKDLVKSLKIQDLPVLNLYKGKKLIWTNKGFITKEEVVKKLKAN